MRRAISFSCGWRYLVPWKCPGYLFGCFFWLHPTEGMTKPFAQELKDWHQRSKKMKSRLGDVGDLKVGWIHVLSSSSGITQLLKSFHQKHLISLMSLGGKPVGIDFVSCGLKGSVLLCQILQGIDGLTVNGQVGRISRAWLAWPKDFPRIIGIGVICCTVGQRLRPVQCLQRRTQKGRGSLLRSKLHQRPDQRH